ncbi:MAG: hypothetical protein LLG20_13915 [Acidobacteriales bacterium]|nr:hypothetical protein [Terriglobales bacterium]
MNRRVAWPNGHKFAFTFVDDADWATMARVRPIYDLITDLGMRSTKTVWMLNASSGARNEGSTCENPAYLDWNLSLQERGFEIALHCASAGSSTREQTRFAIERFRTLFGDRPFIHCNHTGCADNMYWGDARLSGWRRTIYNILTRGRRRHSSWGHVEGSPHFWGDLCRGHVSYVRNFVFDNLNTLEVCPEMPYHDPARPYVNQWFAASDGGSAARFLRNCAPARIDRLAESGGAGIVYVHFAAGFAENGAVREEVRKRLEYIAAKDGWFATTSEILSHLGNGRPLEISWKELRRLEVRWLKACIRRGKTL